MAKSLKATIAELLGKKAADLDKMLSDTLSGLEKNARKTTSAGTTATPRPATPTSPGTTPKDPRFNTERMAAYVPDRVPVAQPVFAEMPQPRAFRHIADIGDSCRGNAQVGAHRQAHAEIADGSREPRPHQEEQRASDPHRRVFGGQREQHDECDGGKDAQGAELSRQIGVGTLLDGQGDGLHVVGAFTGGQHLLAEHRRHRERAERDHEDKNDQHLVGASELRLRDEGLDPRHVRPPGSEFIE